MKNKAFFGGLLAGLVALFTGAAMAQDPVTFTFGSEGNPVQLDAAVVTDGISFRVLRQGCETLLAFEPGTTQPGPGLAKEWSVSEDGLTWVLTLQEGATFHDGSPFNAEAVKWNFDRWRLTDHPEHRDEEGQVFEYYEAQFGGFDDASIITDVQATGEYEVTISLSAPMGAFLNNLAMAMFSIASPAAVEAAGAAYGTPEVGYSCTGPFKFVSWQNDVEVVLERNAEYWGEIAGNIERIVLTVIPDNAARFAALKDGVIDAFERPNVEDIESIEADENLYVQFRPSFNVFYLAFNFRIKEFRDPAFRQAVSLAINRQEIVDAYYASAVPANTFNPPSIAIGFNPDIQTGFDPAAARAALDAAGYPAEITELTLLKVDENGNVTEEEEGKIPFNLYYMPVTRPYNPDGEGIAEVIQTYLSDVGIQTTLASAGDWPAYLDARSNGELLGLYQLGWTGDNGDPDNFIGYFFSGVANPLPREGFYQNAEVADLLVQARTLTDAAERDALYKEAEALVAAGSDRLFIAHGEVPLAFNNRVTGYVPSPMGDEPFALVSVGQ